MKHTRIIAIVLCLIMVVSMFAACDNNPAGTGSNVGGTASSDNEQYIDAETGEIINIGSDKTMAITPEEIGTLANPVVTGLEAWLTESRKKEHVKWKEDAYGLIYECDTCNEEERMAKMITAFVSGDAYDVLWLSSGDFPTIAQKGILQPIDKIMPVHDENYFKTAVSDAFTWKNRVYGVNCFQGVDTYGIIYNETLFSAAGETTPMELYNAGQWTWANFEKLVKSMHSVEGTANDIYGLAASYVYLIKAAVVSNGSSIIEYTATGAEITLNDEKAFEALNWVNKLRNGYVLESGDSRAAFINGKVAMYMERSDQINSCRKGNENYEFSWVPFPVGPKSNSEIIYTGRCSAWGIGKGAKNIAGALAWIASDNYHEEYFEAHPVVIEAETRSDEEKALCEEASNKGVMQNFDGFDISLYGLIEDAKVSGVAAAVEKYTPQFQAKIDAMLGIQSEVGGIDFEDIGVIDFNTTEGDYPFVNVIGDDKISYGTEEAPSLVIDLEGMTDFGTILHTKPELYKLQKGGQYKVTFKLYSAVDPGAETFAIAARTTDNLTGASIVPETWLTFKAGEAVDVEVYLNVNTAFEGDLAIVLLGSATEANPDLNIIIDDFHVELVSGQ